MVLPAVLFPILFGTVGLPFRLTTLQETVKPFADVIRHYPCHNRFHKPVKGGHSDTSLPRETPDSIASITEIWAVRKTNFARICAKSGDGREGAARRGGKIYGRGAKKGLQKAGRCGIVKISQANRRP